MVGLNSKSGKVYVKWSYYFMFLLTFAMFLPIFAGTLRYVSNERYPISETLETTIAYEMIVNTCFAYQDNNGIYHQNVIDPEKVTNERLKSCFILDKDKQTYQKVHVIITSSDTEFGDPLTASTSNTNSKPKIEPCSLRLKSGKIIPCLIEVKT